MKIVTVEILTRRLTSLLSVDTGIRLDTWYNSREDVMTGDREIMSGNCHGLNYHTNVYPASHCWMTLVNPYPG